MGPCRVHVVSGKAWPTVTSGAPGRGPNTCQLVCWLSSRPSVCDVPELCVPIAVAWSRHTLAPTQHCGPTSCAQDEGSAVGLPPAQTLSCQPVSLSIPLGTALTSFQVPRVWVGSCWASAHTLLTVSVCSGLHPPLQGHTKWGSSRGQRSHPGGPQRACAHGPYRKVAAEQGRQAWPASSRAQILALMPTDCVSV